MLNAGPCPTPLSSCESGCVDWLRCQVSFAGTRPVFVNWMKCTPSLKTS